jgi:succinate dehydrogenase / fumarate reductase iron-sulfur subunit
VLIDGVTEYACIARLGPEGTTVEPLDNKALIRDLVTEITPPKERVSAALQGRK